MSGSPRFRVPGETCHDYPRASGLEWLETSGTGGFAMGTVSGAATRRYHALLVASLRPPVERVVVLTHVDERVRFGGRTVALGTHQYPGAVHPEGHKLLTEFRLDPFPVWTFAVPGLGAIEKSVFLVRGRDAVVVRYRLLGAAASAAPCELEIDPFVAFRDYHALGRAAGRTGPGLFSLPSPFGLTAVVRADRAFPALRLHANARAYVGEGEWYYDVEYLRELERGFDYREDLFRVGTFAFDLRAEGSVFVMATLDLDRAPDERAIDELEARERRLRSQDGQHGEVALRLSEAADQFRATRDDGAPTVLAGFPWFTDWGRDAMIALPGLLVARGLLAEAEDVLRGFLRHLDCGLIPNRFPDDGEPPEYNTADATLWLFQAARALWAKGRTEFVRDVVYPHAREILRWHERGTHNGIAVDPRDGLLVAGGEGTQLTWMDARVNGVCVTPRYGKPVEIQALYHGALRATAEWARAFGDGERAARYTRQADRARASFAQFWNVERGCLFDVIRDGYKDPSLRPNQIFAVSLPDELLGPEESRKVVAVVERELLTPYGLRTLAPGEEGYVGRYRGGPAERDAAYHQGTVWPWLLGPFLDAYRRVHGRDEAVRARCRAMLAPLERHLHERCLGQVSEIFDGDAPHAAAGAPAQAWSVSELCRVACELE
jgi:predicted glycogen debranching enzyme